MADDNEALMQARLDIATLEVQFTNMAGQLAELKQALAAINGKLESVNTTLTEARGGWRTLMLVGGATASLGAAVGWAFEHWPKG